MKNNKKGTLRVLTLEEFEMWNLIGYKQEGINVLNPARELVGVMIKGFIFIQEQNM